MTAYLAFACDRPSAETVPLPPMQAVAEQPAEAMRTSNRPPNAPNPVEPRASASSPSRESFDKTVGIVEIKRAGFPRVLRAVRAASDTTHDRVVFEFEDSVPGFRLEYIDKPVRDCGAGDVKPIEGDGWLEVRFYPAYAHTESGQPTVKERELKPRLPIVREIERTCDFEAVVVWVIGTASPNHYRAFELASPPRLVVDIDH